jgi:enamine deaminase RidA (YjgF/YER057c/UK114 family)
MAKRRQVSSGSAFEAAVGYSRAVRAGAYVAVAGTTGTGPDIVSQARDALHRIGVALQEVGASLSDVVRTRMYVTDISLWQEVGAVHAEVFGDIRPVATMVEVSALISPDLLIEIEADAYVVARASQLDIRRLRSEPAVQPGPIRRDADHSRNRQRAVQMWEHHPHGIGGDTGFPANGRGQSCGVDAEQHQIGPAGVEPVGRQMHLLGRGQVYEPVRLKRIGAVLAECLS